MWTIPRETVFSLREGHKGIAVWSLQNALTSVAFTTMADGDFGPATKRSVVMFQSSEKLTADGIAGPRTQAMLGRRIIDPLKSRVPVGLLQGFAQMEGGFLLAPVNWSVAGGVDCGMFQRRVYDEDYDNDAVIQRAFNTAYQARLLADRLVELRSIFLPRTGTRDGYGGMRPEEKAWRLAALNHNYPSAADRLSRTPIHQLASYWTTAQSWVTVHGFKFPDGAPVRTPLEWCHLYAGVLSGAHNHAGNVTKNVTTWTV